MGMSDRQAAETVRRRIDFKYAMALELDDPSFHHSVLAVFRERLAEDGRADRLLDLALARLKEFGLVSERTTQRTDSTHVVAAVHDPTRLEPVTEAVRAALEEVARTAGHLSWRTPEDGGLPPSSLWIVSPYDTTARHVRHRRIIRWKRLRRSSHRDVHRQVST
ncbi:transposase (plasmid) [Streptomyces sp. NBC_01435]|nr:transposase [Streptomyces sp. NBC_01435]